MEVLILLIPAVIIITIIATFGRMKDEIDSLRRSNTYLTEALMEKKTELDSLRVDFARKNREISALTDKIAAFSAENETLRKSLSEAPLGFPSLLEALKQYDLQRDKRLADWLETKSHPAPTAAEIVRDETRKRRDAEQEARKARVLLEYYEESVKEVETLREKTSQLRYIVMELRKQLEESTRTQSELSSQNERLISEKSALAHKLESLHLENAVLYQDSEDFTVIRRELSSLSETLAQKISENLQLGRNLELLRLEFLLMYRALTMTHDIEGITSENDALTRENSKLTHELETLKQQSKVLTKANDEFSHELEILRSENSLLRTSLTEAPLGFPSLLTAIRLYDAKRDNSIVQSFRTKSRPALIAAETIRIETRKRRNAEQGFRRAKLLLDYYFSISPDAQENLEASAEQSAIPTEAPSQDKDEDIAGRYLSNEEYSKLSRTQRNQLALDRFWSCKKSKQTIGRLYEQYIGWLYENNGWLVEYFGISEGFSDMGRDLICHKDNTTLIIQCKNWSKSKRIYEKHIFQLFGTAYEYMKNNPFEEVYGVFFTSTELSDLARSFAKEFHIELHESFELKRFPIIKCNIGREGERIYHLPFDQQYYTTKINHKDGDRYCATVAEAEAMGFRRAYRWHGNRDDF